MPGITGVNVTETSLHGMILHCPYTENSTSLWDSNSKAKQLNSGGRRGRGSGLSAGEPRLSLRSTDSSEDTHMCTRDSPEVKTKNQSKSKNQTPKHLSS